MNDSLQYKNLRFFSRLIHQYLSEEKNVQSLYGLFPTIENFEKQIKLKSSETINREILVKKLKLQYDGISNTDKTLNNVEKLAHNNTFTITTGHQLNLFTGPLYFIYKIVSTIKLTQQLSQKYPDYQFVPIYWMASEDHDFEEINHFHLSEHQKITWQTDQKGAVGRFKTENLQPVYEEFVDNLGEGTSSEELKKLFETSYLQGYTLAQASRVLVHNLFAGYGLVIIDADDADFKRLFIPQITKELKEQIIYTEVSKTNTYLKSQSLDIQVNPRDINLFYLLENSRNRIVKVNENYTVNQTNLVFTENQLLEELEKHPERFSPNVLMRPLYQEVILPNLTYIGGGGEINYWLQLKSAFEHFKTTFPLLIVRNSALFTTEKQEKKWEKLGLDNVDFLQESSKIIEKILDKNTSHPTPDFKVLEQNLRDTISVVSEWATTIEPTFVPGVQATLQKQINEWNAWEQKLHKTLKKKNAETMERTENILKEVFPNRNLQERYLNFSIFYSALGQTFIERLLNEFEPLEFSFKIISKK